MGVVALVAIGGLGALYWRNGSSAPAGAGGRMPPPQASVSVGTVERGDITVTVQALGTVTSTSTVTVRPQVSGQLLSVNFKEGQSVKRGDLIAQIDPRPFQATLDQAKAQVDRDQALLEGAKVDLQRYQGLSAQNAVPRQTLDTQKALVAQYTATIEADKAQVQTASINLDFTQIRAPVDGRAGLRLVDQGNYVTPGDTSGITVLTQLQPISVVFSVPEDRLTEISQRLKAGAKLAVHAFDRTGQNRIAEGVLETFDSQIDQTTGTIKLRASFPNADQRLYPNQFVNVTLDVDTHAGVAIAPTSGIQRGVPGTFAYLLNADQTVSVRPITLGVTTGEKVEILSGLAPGDQIVVEGADRLRDGGHVTVRPGAARTPPPAGAPPARPGVHQGRQPDRAAAQ
ncbi:efflux RND transporter periplasmic adaptor subunit [Xanthobacter oligotrophicus]|uniref:efflux RND transporter periplasmic adaptor subunit n=1 Tax=Xanthobacter oligotrophicus TaxID=2607286 RepID=UPI001E5D4445|nr:efflux RND transporter periplasmic adaptor subunit [Xanthobacter oligotrophicus]MCG5233984.1 efflux RND transporter periplasmic adaptor subunit [Xanthobacter oligotrophicus]